MALIKCPECGKEISDAAESLGVMKNNIEISFGFLMLFAVAQILVNIMISIILCMPIRKISAYVLIKE